MAGCGHGTDGAQRYCMILRCVIFVAVFLPATAMIGYNLKRDDESLLMTLVYGLIISWALAFVVGVPLIIKHKPLSLMLWILLALYGVLAATGLFMCIRRRIIAGPKAPIAPFKKSEIIYLGLFLGIVAFQLYKAIFYACADGDDAFYIATARTAEISNRMYELDAYIGVPVDEMPFRYVFAPFPMWEAVLARVSGVHTATLAHTILPPILIIVTYILYNEISKLLFGAENREKRFMFLTLTAVFEMFANVSTSTSGTFLLTRARQGKEALACIILPLLFYELFRLARAEGELKIKDLMLLFATFGAASLSSLLGNVLAPIMIAGAALWMLVKRKRFGNIVLICTPVIISAATVLMYLKIR